MAKKRVLIAEDDATFAELVELRLKAKHYDVVTFRSGKDALASIQQRTPDVVILDMFLHEMDGLSTLKAIREEAKLDVPVIVTTGRGEAIEPLFRMAGADEFLTKPFAIDRLVEKIESLMVRKPV